MKVTLAVSGVALTLAAAAGTVAIRYQSPEPAPVPTLTCTLTPNPEAGTYENPVTGEIVAGQRWTFSGVECQPLIGADLSLLRNVSGATVLNGPVKSPLMPGETIGFLRMNGW